jgi:Ser/Thr protein kinase RdoA (MazF antagonist)
MTSSARFEPETLITLASALCGRPVTAIAPAGRGGNNRLFQVETAEGRFALKLYPKVAGDDRDRLGVEFNALRFLNRHGIAETPIALMADPSEGAALYSWVDGTAVGSPGDADIDAAAAFLCRLKSLGLAPDAESLPPASEACFSANELIRQNTSRLNRLMQVSTCSDLATFLADGVAPALTRFTAHARMRLPDFERDIAPPLRTLSPSDFGFHNALRQPDGSLIFLDFEYFGWDDPVKLIADTLLHPGMDLDLRQGRHFLAALAPVYARYPGFSERLGALYPLYALRWSLIVLNEFLPERWARRAGAGEIGDRTAIEIRQLDKARRLLARANDTL